MTKKILITGASGFVGSHLVEAAHHLGLEVHAAVRKTSKIDEIKPFVDKFVYPVFDDIDNLKKLFQQENYHYIIHAAALTKAKSENDLVNVNVGYTEKLLEAAFAQSNNLERAVFVSSLAAIGPRAYDTSELNEDSDYIPVTAYGRSKQAAELMLKDKFSDKAISVFRPTAVYGPREKDLFILFDTLNKGFDPYIGKKGQKLSFVYVKDLVDVLLKGCVLPQDGLQFYNISDGKEYSKYAMADIFKETFSKNPLRLHIPFGLVSLVAKISARLYKNSSKTPTIYPERLGELTAENWVCSIEKAKATLGYAPQYDLNKGLRETLLWYKSHNWLK